MLEPARKASVKLQEEQLTIGDFSKLWTTFKMEVEKINTDLPKLSTRPSKQEKNC